MKFAFVLVFFLFKKKYDAIIIHQTSPVTQAWAGVLLGKLRRIPIYTWVLDIWPDSVLATIHSDNAFPDSESVICDLTIAHKQRAKNNEIKASGIAWNATIVSPDGKKSDAIVVSLEHQENYSVVVGLPYKFGLFKKIQFGELFAEEGKNDIF